MICSRLVLFAALAALGACNKSNSPTAGPVPTDTAPGDVSSAPTAGGPQIVTEPDGLHIEYHTYGHGDPAVVLVHGWATDGNYWHAQIAPLEARYTVVTIDLAGHGASEKNRSDWSIERYGEDVATVVHQLAAPHIVLVGHSMGATVALEAARRMDKRLIGIIAVDALKSVGLPPVPAREIEMRIAPFRADFIGETRKYVKDSLFETGADPVLVQKVAYDMSLEAPEVAIPSLKALLALDLSPVIADIHVPVLAINSDLMPTDEARIRRFIPDFRADVLPHTGHFLMMEVPAKFNPILLRDIDSLVEHSRATAGQPAAAQSNRG